MGSPRRFCGREGAEHRLWLKVHSGLLRRASVCLVVVICAAAATSEEATATTLPVGARAGCAAETSTRWPSGSLCSSGAMFRRARSKRGLKRSSGQSGDGRGADGRRRKKRGRSPSRSSSPARSRVSGRENRSRSRRRAPAAASRGIVLRAAEHAPMGASSSAGGVRRRVRRHSPRDGLPSRQRRHAPSPQVAPSGRRSRKARASDQATRPKRKGARQRHAGVVDTQPEERPRVGAKRRLSRLLVGHSVMPLVARRRRKVPVTQTAPSRREGGPRHAVDQPPAPGADGVFAPFHTRALMPPPRRRALRCHAGGCHF